MDKELIVLKTLVTKHDKQVRIYVIGELVDGFEFTMSSLCTFEKVKAESKVRLYEDEDEENFIVQLPVKDESIRLFEYQAPIVVHIDPSPLWKEKQKREKEKQKAEEEAEEEEEEKKLEEAFQVIEEFHERKRIKQ